MVWAVWAALPGPLMLGQEGAWAAGDVVVPPQHSSHGTWHTEAQARASRMAIGRFWGLGPRSRPHKESSYSRAHTSVTLRLGRHVPAVFASLSRGDVGVRLLASYDAVYGSQSATVPSTRSLYPTLPNAAGNTWLSGVALEWREDGMRMGPGQRRGYFAEVSLGVMLGVCHSDTFVLGHIDLRKRWAQTRRMHTAARLWGRYVSSSRAPFFAQSTLGGGHYLRGHADGRFVDQGAWTVEVEQRLHLWTSQGAWGPIAWHLDPFAVVGQVFGPPRQLFEAPRLSLGMGVRAVLRHKLVTRCDIASDFDRIRGHLALGYPF
jgi:hypothetical protein